MSYLKKFTITTISSLLLFSNVFLSKADGEAELFKIWNVGSKEEIFNRAKEQDRFVLVLVGRHTCGICQAVSQSFTNDPQLRNIIDENYVTWFSDRDAPTSIKEVELYTASYDASFEAMSEATQYITNAKILIEKEKYATTQMNASDIVSAKATIEAILSAFPLKGVKASVKDSVFTPAIAGDAETPVGTNGTYTFTINLTKDFGMSITTSLLTLNITATPFASTGDYLLHINQAAYGTVTADQTNPVAEGETVTLTISPAEGYELDEIKVYNSDDADEIVTLTGENDTRTFEMPDFNVTVEATFNLIDGMTITPIPFPDVDRKRWREILENAGFECNDPNLGINIPILCVINPEDPEEDYTVFWKKGSKTTQQLLSLITTPNLFSGSSNLNVDNSNNILFFTKTPSWLSDQKLQWHENINEVLQLAKEQKKYVFKLVGKSTSPNSKKLLKQLYESPFEQLLTDNYILWYSSDISESGSQTEAVTLPYISIIDPEKPDELLEENWGVPEAEILEEILKSYTVSNENILPNPTKAAIWDNTLLISNQTSNEQITVYSLTGQSIASVRKNDTSVSIDASKFPKGILIIRSSAGWTSKVLNP